MSTAQTPRPRVTVDNNVQSCILIDLHRAHRKLHKLLLDIAEDSTRAAGYSNLDTLFLGGKVHKLSPFVAEYETLRTVAKHAGCTDEQVRAVCVPEFVRIDVQQDRAQP